MQHKLGRLPARHTRRTMRSALAMARALDPLGPAPPVSNDYVAAVTAAWGMLGNDRLGDCVPADTGHALMLRTANVSTIVVPTEANVVALYSAVTGFDPNAAPDASGENPTDQGTDEVTMCQYMMSTGWLGHRSAGTGAVDPANLDHVRWCVQLFGSCRLGVTLPQSASDQFDAGQPWDVAGNATIVGGHDVPIVKYDSSYFYVVTWGSLVPMTPAFLARYVANDQGEAHAELYPDWIRSQGLAPAGLDLATLEADLRAIAAP